MVSRDRFRGIDTDATLIERIRQSDADAMTILFDRYHTFVFAVAHNLLRNEMDAEDVTQEVFLGLWGRALPSVSEDRTNIKPWLCVVARNRAISVIRGKKSTLTQPVEGLLSTHNLEKACITSLDVRKLAKLIDDLPVQQQLCLRSVYILGQSHLEFALDQGQPHGTIKSRVRAALQSLRKTLVSKSQSVIES